MPWRRWGSTDGANSNWPLVGSGVSGTVIPVLPAEHRVWLRIAFVDRDPPLGLGERATVEVAQPEGQNTWPGAIRVASQAHWEVRLNAAAPPEPGDGGRPRLAAARGDVEVLGLQIVSPTETATPEGFSTRGHAESDSDAEADSNAHPNQVLPPVMRHAQYQALLRGNARVVPVDLEPLYRIAATDERWWKLQTHADGDVLGQLPRGAVWYLAGVWEGVS